MASKALSKWCCVGRRGRGKYDTTSTGETAKHHNDVQNIELIKMIEPVKSNETQANNSSRQKQIEVNITDLEQYHYATLQPEEFRVLELLPADWGEQIHCKLHHYNIESAGIHSKHHNQSIRSAGGKVQYEAVSYAWGDKNLTHSVVCNDARVRVTESLSTALQYLRLTDRPRWLWADALCIDQKNDQERGHQVQHMGQIYSNAQKTLIWLGEDPEGTLNCLTRLSDWLKWHSSDRNWDNVPISWVSRDRFEFDGTELSPTDLSWLQYQQEHLPTILEIFAKQWWQRKWVVQELVLSKSAVLICGRNSIPFADLPLPWRSPTTHAIRVVTNKLELIDAGLANDSWLGLVHLKDLDQMISDHHGKRKGSARLTLWNALRKSRDFACSEPRDHLYAVLGIATDVSSSAHKDLLKVDYKASVADVASRLTEWLIITYQPFLFCFGKLPGVRMKYSKLSQGMFTGSSVPPLKCKTSCPSWCYQLVEETPKYTPYLTRPVGFLNVDAGRSSTHMSPTWSVLPDNILCLQGRILGKIKEILNYAPESEPSVVVLQNWLDNSLFLLEARGYKLSESIDTVMEALMSGSLEARQRLLREVRKLREYLLAVKEYGIGSEESLEVFKNVSYSIRRALLGASTRYLCLTTTGHIGWVSPHAKLGDEICMIPGAKALYTIAKFGKEHYNYIGECYFQGLMKGEAFDMDIQDQPIKLY